MNINDINFSELQVREIGMWPLVLRIAVIVAAAIIAFGLVFYFLINTELTELETEKATQEQRRKDYQEKYNLAINLSAYEAQMVDIQKMYTLVLRQLPSDSHIPELIESITRLAERNSIKITSIKLGDPQTLLGAYRELPIDLSLIGTYHSIGKFISDVAKLSRIVTLEDFTLKPSSARDDKNSATSGLLVMNMKAKTYWLANAQEIEEAAKKDKAAGGAAAAGASAPRARGKGAARGGAKAPEAAAPAPDAGGAESVPKAFTQPGATAPAATEATQ